MPPANDLVKARIVEGVVTALDGVEPSSNSDYWARFDWVDSVDPPPEGFLDRDGGYDVPAEYERVAFVWYDDDPRELRDTSRSSGKLSLIVTVAQRYPFDDKFPFAPKDPNFLPRWKVRTRMESDVMLALKDLRLDGIAVLSNHADTRPMLINTRLRDYPWVEVELMYDIEYKYVRSAPWLQIPA